MIIRIAGIEALEHLGCYVVAEVIVFVANHLAQASVFRMFGYCLFITQQRQCLVSPITIEKCLLERHQVFACHFIAAKNQIGLSQPFVASTTFLKVEYGFLRLENRTLGNRDHSQLIVYLGCRQWTGSIALDIRQQACNTILVVVEEVVDELAVHG